MGQKRQIFSGELWLNFTGMVKSFPFIQIQTSFQLESIKLENGYSSEEGEELCGLQFSFLKLLKTFFPPENSFASLC